MLTTGAAIGIPMAGAHNDAGLVVPPLPAPDIPIAWHNGRHATMRAALLGRVTAVQTMFTGCSATCPIQGALFSASQSIVTGAAHRAQWLSLSIDPLSDDARALARWLSRFNAQPNWKAGAPTIQTVDAMLDFLRARKANADRHTAQVYLFNAKAELVLRTADFPAPELVAKLVDELVARGSG